MYIVKFDYLDNGAKRSCGAFVSASSMEDCKAKVVGAFNGAEVTSMSRFDAELFEVSEDCEDVWKVKVRTTVVDESKGREVARNVVCLISQSDFKAACLCAERYADGFACGADVVEVVRTDYVIII